jgi:signal transduction histidine kinase
VGKKARTAAASVIGSNGFGITPAAHLIEIAYGNCRRLVRLVNDILNIKKLEAGQTEFNFQRCGALVLVEQAIEANHEFAEGYGVHIRLDAAAKAFDVLVDPDRFMQVITNLLSNAAKFSPSGDEVVVSIEARGSNVDIAVRDHGAGIPPAFKPRVFEKFAQANGGNWPHKTGTGLGLSIVRQIVLYMQGQVEFDDGPGGGTIFYVDLPSADHPTLWPADAAAEAHATPLAPDE